MPAYPAFDRTASGAPVPPVGAAPGFAPPPPSVFSRPGYMSLNLLDNPKLLSAFIIEIRDITIPQYIQPIINEGIADGSIKTKYPNETSEMIAVLLNLWLNPLIFQSEQIKLSNKMKIVNMMLEKFGVKLFDEELISKIENQ